MQALLLGAAAVDSEPLSFCRECEASNAFSVVLKRRISRGITGGFNGVRKVSGSRSLVYAVHIFTKSLRGSHGRYHETQIDPVQGGL